MSTLETGSPALFYLGAHQPHWLWRASFPLFVSHRQLARRVTLHPASCRWALDSGGFTELQRFGRWTVTPEEYVTAVRRYRNHIGHLDWAAPQDWMCEPAIIQGGKWGSQRFAGTGLSVPEHQRRTVDNFLRLRELAPELPFIPVLQGWTLDDYLACVELYRSAGVDLARLPRVGLGSVCRRQSTAEITNIVYTLHRAGLRMHGFGVKTGGLHRYGYDLASADSMAWSYAARRLPPLPDCTGHKNCANCLTYATKWRARLLTALSQRGHQGELFDTYGRDAA